MSRVLHEHAEAVPHNGRALLKEFPGRTNLVWAKIVQFSESALVETSGRLHHRKLSGGRILQWTKHLLCEGPPPVKEVDE